MDLGERLRTWLQALGVSQQELAEGLGIWPGAVSMWVSPKALAKNRRTRPTQEHLESTVEFLGLTMAEFYGPLPIPLATSDEAAS